MEIRAVGVIGSRGYPRLDIVSDFVNKLGAKYPDVLVVSGYARGVDRTAELSAVAAHLHTRSYRPVEVAGQFAVRVFENGQPTGYVRDSNKLILYYPSYGEAARARNTWIVRDVDVLVAFWDGTSGGTGDTLRKARAARKSRYVYGADGRLLDVATEQRGLFDLGSTDS